MDTISCEDPMVGTAIISDRHVVRIGEDGMMRKFLKEMWESILAELILFILTWKIRLAFSMMVFVVLAVIVIMADVFG